ncbi:uncharacterized protein LOC125942820 [Dermacentor silvarum]|uniref:uncharacterized protein LOC125942820 n=1 Tax=Dermacentor silvarum TaxID=543639 RepID=UPI002100CD92|nr:uncharacterized protein LOC125942820 [Dermacentor silvarum]
MATGTGSTGTLAASSAAASLHGMAQLRPPPAFDFDNPSSWPSWLLQYEDYSFATGLYAAPTEVQVRSMLYCMGPQARVVLASTTLGDADLKDVVAVKKAFNDHFVHPPNELYESARFHRRTQQPGESADAFYTALRTMVKRCNYSSSDIEERLVRDRFLVGLLDRKLSDQLCRNSRLTLHEALTHVRQHEDADNERNARDSADSSTLAIDTARVRTNVARVRKEKPVSASPDRTTQQLCPFGGRTSHPRADCPARRASCNFCRKSGHFENVCLKKKRGSRKRTPKPSASSIELHAVAGERPNAKFVEVFVDGCPLSFKVDSGAEVYIVPSTYVATLSWHDKFTKQLLYVLATKTVPLLGFPAIQALGVCTFVDQVSGTPQPSGDLRLDPSLFRGLQTLVSNCPTCAETRVQCSEPMLPSVTPTRPWEEVGVDLFHLNGQDYVLLVDYPSRFPEVISLRSTSAPAVINVIKSVFARHGIPRLVRSDNGSQFAAREFSAFADSYGFRHVTSSPHFPQSNGEVERMVRTVKDLLHKADDPYLALLAYRDTPGVNGVSPAQLLMGRRLQTRVPKASHQLEPTWSLLGVIKITAGAKHLTSTEDTRLMNCGLFRQANRSGCGTSPPPRSSWGQHNALAPTWWRLPQVYSSATGCT